MYEPNASNAVTLPMAIHELNIGDKRCAFGDHRLRRHVKDDLR